MSQAIFYLLQRDAVLNATEKVQLTACQMARLHYADGAQVYIHCNDKTQAYAIDEQLWQFEADSFVPHNLKGEGPSTGAPVEIGFDNLGPNKLRQVLINLADQSPSFAVNFDHIIDFVASDDDLKAIARHRYKQYRALGIPLSTQDLATEPLKSV
ncbi:DNA polymerase III subunit chi [Shewanella sp. NFH-SH190041]|uniref:DNA polymerase III subunit chi n=1 Tax=Shewanella sp. NFH-SH190041 TaxID=2950245 RepID=UPI0021C3AB69|nr:DNA polymerase III subunit chi [Shewanella sp. NFH-SH190041]BDM63425.1 DNA polymerase III subunit chi [Shewanella sp. NFH-SH190041]